MLEAADFCLSAFKEFMIELPLEFKVLVQYFIVIQHILIAAIVYICVPLLHNQVVCVSNPTLCAFRVDYWLWQNY